jgi:hypothetical protein
MGMISNIAIAIIKYKAYRARISIKLCIKAPNSIYTKSSKIVGKTIHDREYCSLYVLSEPELRLREELELAVRTGFVLRGEALEKIKKLKLYRDQYDSFEEYCDAVFGFTALYIKRCITAAQTYHYIKEYLETNCLDDPLPNKQSQLRPIFQAHLSPIEAGEVWVMAVSLAFKEVPPASVVKEALKAYLQQKYPTINSFSVGQVCRIKEGVRGKQNCWCIISEVRANECSVDTWDGQYVVSVNDLSPIKMTKAGREQMLDLGERMTAIGEVGKLDEAAFWILRGLEKLKHSQLNSLEEKLLLVLEEEYLGRSQ